MEIGGWDRGWGGWSASSIAASSPERASRHIVPPFLPHATYHTYPLAGLVMFLSELLLAGSLLTFQAPRVMKSAAKQLHISAPSLARATLRDRLFDAVVISILYVPVSISAVVACQQGERCCCCVQRRPAGPHVVVISILYVLVSAACGYCLVLSLPVRMCR